jgi:hypothetical protein
MQRAAERNYVGVRYAPPARRGHVESYFLKANDPERRRAIWLKATVYQPRAPNGPVPAIAESWAIAFDGDAEHVAVKSTVPYDRARFSPTELDVEVDGLVLRAGETRGTVASGGRAIAWSLAIESDGAPLVHYPADWMYSAPFPSSKLVSPLPDLRLRGEIVVNGTPWRVDGWRGLLGHNWGPRHTPLYGWGHCNVWQEGKENEADELVIEGVSGRVRAFGLLAPTTTLICVRHRGVRYDLNAALDLVRNRGEITPRRWKFEGENDLVRVRGEMWGETDDFVGLFYANPDGTMTHCLNTKIGRARVELALRGRAPFVVHSSAAALEIGTMNPDHGVRMYV